MGTLPTVDDKIAQLYELLGTKDDIDQKLAEAKKSLPPDMPIKLQGKLLARMSDAVKELEVKSKDAMRKFYTVSDLNALIMFYNSDIGKRSREFRQQNEKILENFVKSFFGDIMEMVMKEALTGMTPDDLADLQKSLKEGGN